MKKLSPQAFVLAASLLLVISTTSSVASAQHYCRNCQTPSLAQTFRAGYDANVDWPRPYIPPARSAVCQTYNAMINNGWRRQNLLGDYHFNPETNELTNAGKLKVNWILSQAPVTRRSIFVQRGGQELATTARVSAVHDYAGNMSPSVGQIDVNDTHLVAEGHRASSVDSVFVGYETNRAVPRLPVIGAGGGGGGTQ